MSNWNKSKTGLYVKDSSDKRKDSEQRRNILDVIASEPRIKRWGEDSYIFCDSSLALHIKYDDSVSLSIAGKSNISVEKVLSDVFIDKWIRKFIMFNLDIFTKDQDKIGWYVHENIGVAICNPKGLSSLKVK